MDESREIQQEIAGFLLSSGRSDQVIEVGKRMPSYERSPWTLFKGVEKPGCRLGKRLPIERQVDQDVCIEKDDHR